MYNSVPFGRGTLSVLPTYPTGTDTVFVNCALEATESIRNKLLALNLHWWSGASWQRISFKVGKRTTFASGCQSDLELSAPSSRNCSGPTAEGPKFFSG